MYYRLIQALGSGPEVFQLLLPQCLQEEVLRSVHDNQGHQGTERILHLLRSRCFWPKMAQDVEEWCQRCQRCVLGKAVQAKVRTYWGMLQAGRPNEILAMDFTSLEPASDGRENVLVLTDVFTKYVQAVPTQDQRATTVARILVQQWVHRFGPPTRIHSDQGRNFESLVIQQLCQIYGIQKSRTTPYHTRKGTANARGSIGHCMTCCAPCLRQRSGNGPIICPSSLTPTIRLPTRPPGTPRTSSCSVSTPGCQWTFPRHQYYASGAWQPGGMDPEAPAEPDHNT